MTAPGPLTIVSAPAGSNPTSVTDQSARYSVTVVSGRMRITARLDNPPPAGVTMTISLTAPAGAVSLGTVTLTSSDQNVVRYIPVGQYPGLTVTLSLAATVTAGAVGYHASNVILTLSDDP
ncbi:MAG TPA: hypothetical protein VN706_00070 [Gemmatimonadaceae bacterium]|nr:hypothetical protein [Gemmatimonadaceae bacterium]